MEPSVFRSCSWKGSPPVRSSWHPNACASSSSTNTIRLTSAIESTLLLLSIRTVSPLFLSCWVLARVSLRVSTARKIAVLTASGVIDELPFDLILSGSKMLRLSVSRSVARLGGLRCVAISNRAQPKQKLLIG